MFHLKSHRQDQRQILDDAAIDAMQSETVPAGTRSYGLGWWTEGRFAFPSVVANGGTLSDQAWVWLAPTERIAVVVLSNYGSVNTGRIIDEVMWLCCGRKERHARLRVLSWRLSRMRPSPGFGRGSSGPSTETCLCP